MYDITFTGQVMVLTGEPHSHGIKTEVIDLDNPNAKCDLLAETSGRIGAFGGFIQNKAVICGGSKQDGHNKIILPQSCFIFGQRGTQGDQKWAF